MNERLRRIYLILRETDFYAFIIALTIVIPTMVAFALGKTIPDPLWTVVIAIFSFFGGRATAKRPKQ